MHGAGRLLLLAVIALVHVGGIWWLALGRERAEDAMAEAPEPLPPEAPPLSDVPAETADVPGDEGGQPTTDATADIQLPSTPAGASDNAPLPPPGTPLASVLEELEARADRGDKAAACRLALEGEICLRNRDAGQSAAFFERNAAREPAVDDAIVQFIADIEAEGEAAAALCAGVPGTWADTSAWRHMLSAAQTDSRLATRFAVSPPLDWSMEDLQGDAWAAYRATAPGLLERAAAAGDLRAIYFLQRLLNGERVANFPPDAIAPDPARALMYAMALLDHVDAAEAARLQAQIDAGHAAFDDSAWRRLQSDAATLAARFKDQPPIDNANGVLGEPDPQMCAAQ